MILVYFDKINFKDYRENNVYQEAYNYIAKILQKEYNIYCYFWDGNISKDGDIKVEICNLNKTEYFEKKFKDVSVVFVRGVNFNYNKYLNYNKHFQYFNTFKIENICNNKKLTYKYLGKELMPKEYLSLKELNNKNIYTVKPADGLKGEGIQFLSKQEIQNQKVFNNKNLIVQDKIEYSFESLKNLLGKENVKNVKSYDFRIVFCATEFSLFLVRYSEKEISNIAQGGKSQTFDATYVKEKDYELYQILTLIKRTLFQKLPLEFKNSIFSVDFCITKDNKIKVFELNSKPGVNLNYDKYINSIINFLVEQNYIYIKKLQKINYNSSIFSKDVFINFEENNVSTTVSSPNMYIATNSNNTNN